MSDELLGTPEPASGGGEPEPQPQAPVTAPAVIPEEPGVLKARLEEKESFIGRQSKEIGDLRNQLGYLQNMVEGIQTARPPEPSRTPPPPQGTPTDFYDRPMDYVNQAVGYGLMAVEERRQQQDQVRRAQEAEANFYEGRDAAYKGNKRLFDGIENEVENSLHQLYRSGMINERSLSSQKTWERTAQLIRLDKGVGVDRVIPLTPKPMSATQTETPSGKPMQYGDSVEIDESTRQWGRDQGLDDKKIEELMKKEAVARGRGKNIARQGYGS